MNVGQSSARAPATSAASSRKTDTDWAANDADRPRVAKGVSMLRRFTWSSSERREAVREFDALPTVVDWQL